MSAEQGEQQGSLHADRPIKKKAEDKLGRAGFARSIATQIQLAPRGESFVIGLVGPWGSGKTSILNMIEEELGWDSSLLFLSFNPWLFAGHKELVAHFFHEIAAQIRDEDRGELRDIWRGFEGYSRLLRPLRAVPGVERDAPADVREPSVRRQRQVLAEALSNARQRLVIVLDDLDRLEDEEIRDVMRLVRLLADFPNTTYVLSYDQKRVVEALGREERGRAYLEKIVQVVHHVPEVRENDLLRILADGLNAVLNETPHLPSAQGYLQKMFLLGIGPLFEGLRDVYRYINALRPTLAQIGDEVVAADLLALEAIRVLEPDVILALAENADLLAPKGVTWGASSREEHEKREKSKQALFARGGRRTERVQRLIERLFPAIGGSYASNSLGEWRKERRVAHPEVFRVYIERVLPEGAIPTRIVRAFVEKLGDEQALSSYLTSMSPAELEQMFQRLEDYEQEFQRDESGNAVKVLLDQLSRLREGSLHTFDRSAEMLLMRVILRLLRPLDPAKRLATLERQLPRMKLLSSRALLLHLVKVNDEHQFVDKNHIVTLEADLARSVIEAPVAQLSTERSLMRLLDDARAHDEAAVVEKIRQLSEDDAALVRMLASGMSESWSSAMGSEFSLAWDDLEQIVGPEKLRGRLQALDTRRKEMSLGERETQALDTALRYLEGWRPTSETFRRTAVTKQNESSDDEEFEDEEGDDAREVGFGDEPT